MLLSHFSKAKIHDHPLSAYLKGEIKVTDFSVLKEIMDYVQIDQGLLAAYDKDYPLLDPRELVPSFEETSKEYKNLPHFSMLALDRDVDYQAEPFQFDLLFTEDDDLPRSPGGRKLGYRAMNDELFRSRLPKELHHAFQDSLEKRDITAMDNYPALVPFLFHMDRAHVLARDLDDDFRLLGIFASFPSDLHHELKKLGLKMGKFKAGDNESYQSNRIMVYRFLMELYGFPIASERRTSAALFARELSRRKERYLIKVLGQSDRVITTLYNPDKTAAFPTVEKVALVPLSFRPMEKLSELEHQGYFLDPARRVVIVRAIYQQHPYNNRNIMEERALSLLRQEIIHPRTGERRDDCDVLPTREDRLIILNDIVRGEHIGRISYRNHEIIEGTTDHEKRLKFLSAWLLKHQRRFVSASTTLMDKTEKIFHSYLNNPRMASVFKQYPLLHEEIVEQIAYIRQANAAHRLQQALGAKTKPNYLQKLNSIREFLLQHQMDLPDFDEPIFSKIMYYCEDVLGNKRLLKSYIQNPAQTEYAQLVQERHKEVAMIKNQIEGAYFSLHNVV